MTPKARAASRPLSGLSQRHVIRESRAGARAVMAITKMRKIVAADLDADPESVAPLQGAAPAPNTGTGLQGQQSHQYAKKIGINVKALTFKIFSIVDFSCNTRLQK